MLASIGNALCDIIIVELSMRVTSGAWAVHIAVCRQAAFKHVIWTPKRMPKTWHEPNQTFLEIPENWCPHPYSTWQNLSGSAETMAEYSLIQERKTCGIPEDTGSCDPGWRCFNQGLSKGSKYLRQCSVEILFSNQICKKKSLFSCCLSGILSADWWGYVTISFE